jgi:hypothetical protein
LRTRSILGDSSGEIEADDSFGKNFYGICPDRLRDANLPAGDRNQLFGLEDLGQPPASMGPSHIARWPACGNRNPVRVWAWRNSPSDFPRTCSEGQEPASRNNSDPDRLGGRVSRADLARRSTKSCHAMRCHALNRTVDAGNEFRVAANMTAWLRF